ncbi:MAG: hypothetical protein LBS55_01580 [Prevotellaceae bacterium]|jgi:hypothetical protein|nr:hypothetical protein [Prevotellaceae bacterium]
METGQQKENHPKSFIIANPIYDTVFKKLMENERIAKFFLSTILEEQVVSVDIRPQEFTYKDNKKFDKMPEGIGYSIYRIDFMATIKTEKGTYKKILIEVQKSKDVDDLMRFRNYLAEQYKKVDKVNGVDIVLPITTIYVVGFSIVEIKSPCVKIDRNYIDMISKEPIKARSSFIENLTHDSYVIQTKKITNERYGTKLEKLLSLFEQAHFISKESKISKQYSPAFVDDDIQLITSVLQEMIADPNEREEMTKEEEAMRVMAVYLEKQKKKQQHIIEEQTKVIEEKDKALGEKDKALGEKDKAIKKQAKALEEQSKTLEEQAKQIVELKRLLDKE